MKEHYWGGGSRGRLQKRNLEMLHRHIVICARKAKAQQELKVKRGKKASFCHCMSDNRINKENVDLLLNRTGDSVTMDTDKKSSDALSLQNLLSFSFHQDLSRVLKDNLTTS